MKQNVFKQLAIVLMSLTVVFTNVDSTRTLAIEKEEQFTRKITKYTNLENLKGNFESIEQGYLIHKANGDNHNISDLKSFAFTYESEISFMNGNSASLIFGAEGNTVNELGKFFGLEVSKGGESEKEIYIKMFQNPIGIGLGDNVISRVKVTEVANSSLPIKIKIMVDKDSNLKLYVNNIEIHYTFNKNFSAAYSGGYFGMLTYNTEAKFEKINLEIEDPEVSDFRTNLDNLRGLSGIWNEQSTGLFSSGNHDNFAISDTVVEDFEYSANIKNNGKNGAGALVFRALDNPGAGSYVINVDYTNKVIKLFSFPSGGIIKQVPLSSVAEKSDGSYDIKVQAVGDQILIYANGKGIMKVTNTQRTSGKLGLLTWNGSATYQDVKYKALSALPDVGNPKLTALNIETEGVSITPAFHEKTTIYAMDIKPGVDEVIVKPKANGKLYLSKNDEYGNVIEAKKEITESFMIKKEEFVENYMNIYLTVESDEGFTKEIRFTVYKWYSNEEMAKQEYRSQFHVTPQSNFMNDPNGMVYDSTDGYWHLFYQQSTVNTFRDQSWAHVRSKDLVNWEQQPLGIQIDEDGLIFSGSAIEDKDNDSGLFSDNNPGESKLIAYYTRDTPNVVQQQALAYSKDHGVTWTKYGIVVPGSETISGINFRDPKVFKIEDNWYMVTAGGRAQIHTSTDLIHWTKSQALTYKNGDIIDSECPMLYPAKVNGTGEKKWIYGGSAGFYVVGKMTKGEDGIYKWTAESDKLNVDSNANPWGGFGKYATMTFFEDGTGQNRQIGISWLIDFVEFEGRHYRGVQTLPQEYGLKQDDNGAYIITSKPVEEVEKLRDMNHILYSTKNKVVNATDENILKKASGIRYDLDAEFTLGSATEFGFKLKKGNGKEVVFKYDVNAKQMKLDVSNAGPHTNSGNYSYTLVPTKDGKIRLRLIVDQGAIEAFGNDGEANISTIAYTNNDHIGMEFFTVNGDVTIDKIDIYDMKSMFTGKSGSETDTTKLSISAPEYVEVGQLFEVDAKIYPNKGEGNVIWSYDESLEKVSEDSTSILFQATKSGTYEITAKSKDGLLERKVSIKVIKPEFKTNITGWNTKSGIWSIMEEGVRGFNANVGDSFYLSNVKLSKDVAFTYEGDMHLEHGQAAGLVFGVSDENNPGANWYCVNIDKVADGGIAKIFKNTGHQDWNVVKSLTQEQKDKKDYRLRIEYDGISKLSYYLDNVLIGENENSGFNGGYIGVLTFKADATFNNVTIDTESSIASIVSVFEDIQAQQNVSTLEDIQNKLAKEVIVEQEDGVKRIVPVTWNYDNLDLATPGEYIIKGIVEDFDGVTTVKVIVQEEVIFKRINYENIVISIPLGSTKDDVLKQLNLLKIVGQYSNEKQFEMNIFNWGYETIDFTKEGVYNSYILLTKGNNLTRNTRATKERVMFQVKISKATEMIAPSVNEKPNITIKAPPTGDNTSHLSLYLLMMMSTIIILGQRKKKRLKK